jgi:hypothetical protein
MLVHGRSWTFSFSQLGTRALLLASWKNERLDKAQHTPNSQEREAFESKTLKLEKKLGDRERDQERNRLLPDGNPNTKVLDKGKHGLILKLIQREVADTSLRSPHERCKTVPTPCCQMTF